MRKVKIPMMAFPPLAIKEPKWKLVLLKLEGLRISSSRISLIIVTYAVIISLFLSLNLMLVSISKMSSWPIFLIARITGSCASALFENYRVTRCFRVNRVMRSSSEIDPYLIRVSLKPNRTTKAYLQD